MATVAGRLLTVDDFLRSDPEGHCELVRGAVVTMGPKTWRHGRLADGIDHLLNTYLETHPIGRVAVEAGFVTTRDPDTVRIPDLVFVSFARWSPEEEQAIIDSDEVLPVAPDLAVEILSPDDRWSDTEEKIDEYLRAGVLLTWIVDPRRQTVHVYRADGSVRRLTPSDRLSGEEILPGLELSVPDLLIKRRRA
jgi:Uma2 family endonuclease